MVRFVVGPCSAPDQVSDARGILSSLTCDPCGQMMWAHITPSSPLEPVRAVTSVRQLVESGLRTEAGAELSGLSPPNHCPAGLTAGFHRQGCCRGGASLFIRDVARPRFLSRVAVPGDQADCSLLGSSNRPSPHRPPLLFVALMALELGSRAWSRVEERTEMTDDDDLGKDADAKTSISGVPVLVSLPPLLTKTQGDCPGLGRLLPAQLWSLLCGGLACP